VIANMWVDANAFIASRDGTITALPLGGLSTTLPPPPRESSPAGTSRWAAIHLHGERNIATILFGRVSRRSRSCMGLLGARSGRYAPAPRSRLVDPVFAEVSTPTASSADRNRGRFQGRKIANYRYGLLTFATQGGAKFGVGATGRRPFDVAARSIFRGYPFAERDECELRLRPQH